MPRWNPSTRAGRISNRERQRQAHRAILAAQRTQQEAQKPFAALMAVLAQHGGEVTVSRDVLMSVQDQFARLGYEMVDAGPAGMTIRTITTEQTGD